MTNDVRELSHVNGRGRDAFPCAASEGDSPRLGRKKGAKVAAAEKKAGIADALDEQFYQINLDILESFSKYRPPLALYRFREDVARVVPFCRAGDRLSN